MSNQGHGPRSGGRRHGGGTRTDSDPGKISPSVSVPHSLFNPLELQVTPESTVTNATRTISPRNSKFTELVLHPRRNNHQRYQLDRAKRILPFRDKEGETIDYKGIAGLSGANIWIILDGDSVEDITMEYREMRGLGLCEEEFATFAKRNSSQGELRSRTVSEDRQWRADRMLQLVCPPKESAHWRIPPLLDVTMAGRGISGLTALIGCSSGI
jgi:hypothetical protein